MSTPDPRAELPDLNDLRSRVMDELAKATPRGSVFGPGPVKILETALRVAGEEIKRLQAELGTAREMRPDTGGWAVSVSIPAALPAAMRDSLFGAVAAAVHAWEPPDRDGWDVDVSGHPAPWPCPDARVHTADQQTLEPGAPTLLEDLQWAVSDWLDKPHKRERWDALCALLPEDWSSHGNPLWQGWPEERDPAAHQSPGEPGGES